MADSGEGPGGGPDPLIFRPTEAWRAKKICFGDQAPPYLRVWVTGLPSPLHCISRSGSGTVKQQCGTWQIVSVFEEIHLFTVQDILLMTAVVHWQVFFGYSCYVFKTEVRLYCFSSNLFENALHHWVSHDHFLGDIWGNYEGKLGQKELFLLVLCSPLSLGKA